MVKLRLTKAHPEVSQESKAGFQSRTIWSEPPVANWRPSGLNATAFIPSVWPVSGGPWGWPVVGSQSRMV
jgi:hypothetical protein